MVRVKGPMLSLDARGSLGTAVNFSKNRGVNYTRKIPRPVNPKSPSQVSYRAVLAFLSAQWQNLSDNEKETWEALLNLPDDTLRAAFIGQNLSRWHTDAGLWKTYQPTPPELPPTAPVVLLANHTKRIDLLCRKTVVPPTWGWAIYRSLTNGFTPLNTTLVGLLVHVGVAVVYQDFPLLSGQTYYYRVRGFGTHASLGLFCPQLTGTPL